MPSSRATQPLAGLSGMAVYLPPCRVDLHKWCEWSGSDWEKIRQVVGTGFRMLGPWQSVYTMAANACLRLIERYDVDPAKVRYLALGTESSTDNSAGAIIVKGMLDMALRAKGRPTLARNCEVPEFKHACLGGIYALRGALRFLQTDGSDGVAIVVCTDKALYGRGSTGEPTQGAGAVAMLLEPQPQLAGIDLRLAGTASEYRGIDFRKPLGARQGTRAGAASLDIPVYNGRYSTNCYIDEIHRALDDLYSRSSLSPAAYLRSLEAVFMHRPYQRMPETGLGLAWLFALARGDSADRDELAGYSRGAGLAVADVIAEMNAAPALADLAVQARIHEEVFPLSTTVLKVFRESETFSQQVLGKMTLGSEWMREVGNLYTGALPAWLAAGFADARQRGIELAGTELLAIGYGSGDAADAIPLRVVAGWQDAAARIGIETALQPSVDVSAAQYLALREGRQPEDLHIDHADEFIIDHIGSRSDRTFQDLGVEYYRYIG
ncbi:MAG: hydroxymethylglutaryl-CoA synthase [Gammaproteobacteria bacterium]|nr:hydroxymethylglutaryl-CoA synthase [Gammaproteobacteria bacterium]